MIGAALALATTLGAVPAGPLPPDPAPANTEILKVPTFGTITIYRTATQPRQIVLFVSGDGGWNLGVIEMAERLRDVGALVVGIDIRAFGRSLEASAQCAYPAGALEDLSRAVQRRYGLPIYHRPILVGYSSGATLAYAAIVAAPPETFAGAISLGFCPDIEMRRALCHMRGLSASPRAKGVGYDLAPYAASSVPWMILQGEQDQVCDAAATRAFASHTGAARLFELPKVGHGFGVPPRWVPQFLEAYRAIEDALANATPPARPAPPDIADLSLVEVPVLGPRAGKTMAIVLSGDGGWAEIDKRLAAGLSEAGIPVIGWSSLDYYWTPRTPGGAATDLGRIIDHYTRVWQADTVLVVGYSFGADVAPFLVNRLSAAQKSRVSALALVGPSAQASFEFHVTDWLGSGARGSPTAPEIGRLTVPVTCISAEDEADTVCRSVGAPRVRAVAIGKGHHLSGDYDRIVRTILGSAAAP